MNHQDNNNTPRAPISDKAKTLGLILPVLLLCVGFLAGLCWFLRPAASETEKRELTEFPAFTVESFLSGEFTDQVSLWYADTFPGREGFIKAYHGIQSLFGLRGEQFQQGDMGDDIPDGPMDPNAPVDRPTNGGEGGEQVGGYYLVGDTAYELYSFSQANAQTYASLMNKAAATLEGKANVYDLIIPLHYSFALSAEVQDQHKLPDADQAIRYMYSGMNEDVHTVNAYAALMAHKDEYIYFRTDHHWTATGAYYAYEAYCQAAGITPTPLSSYEKLTFGGFLGTLYSKTGQPAAMGGNPDSVEAYVPKGTNDLYTYDEKGVRTLWRGGVVRRETDKFYAAAASKYNCFIVGDNPLTEIHNERISADRKGTTVLLVKESFGNAFAPFLVDSYEYVYVVDYRYYKGGTLGQLVADKGVDDVIFLNNVVAATGGARLSEMEDFIG